ncbi:MAG: N-acyl homoserine lactonase family protein [Parvibaculaceae bacterium]
MSDDTYELYAVRYGHHQRRSPQNFLGGDPHDTDMPLDYFVWAVVGAARTFILDTGYDRMSADRRGRNLLRPVNEGLAMIGIDHARVTDVIISHMHYDHCGNHHLFPAATFHLQDAEMNYATGRCMCHHAVNHPFDVDDVANMVRRVYDGRVCFHGGDEELAPGLSLHLVGGHSRGLQVVRAKTRNGTVILASDATHFYANMDRGKPFPVFDNSADVMAGFDRMKTLAGPKGHIVPGHDPLVVTRHIRALDTVTDIVRLDLPSSS